MDYQTLNITQHSNEIVILTLNRPAVRNAINFQMMQELKDFWHNIALQKDTIRCIIVTGTAPAFCAGADLKERLNLDLDTWRKQHVVLEQAMLAMLDCPIPIIAAVNGAAFGGGLEIALMCDFAYAAETATFSQSETKIGLIPGALGTQNLPNACGLRRAKELAFTGQVFNANDAYQWGVVNQIFKSDALLNAAIDTAQKIAANAPFAIRLTKKAMNVAQYLDLKSGYHFELESYYQVLPTSDREEGIRSFNEKRSAKFTGK